MEKGTPKTNGLYNMIIFLNLMHENFQDFWNVNYQELKSAEAKIVIFCLQGYRVGKMAIDTRKNGRSGVKNSVGKNEAKLDFDLNPWSTFN